MISRLFLAAAFAFLFAATAASPAFAHLLPGEHGSFAAGFSHPMFGLDHVLVMVTVGLWAAMVGGRAVWLVPAAFVGAMVAGFVYALMGGPLPFVEPAILASVVALGLLVALAIRLPAPICAAVVALFALFHGHAHGAEIGEAGAFVYCAGFAAATAALHGVGVALGVYCVKLFGNGRAGNMVMRGMGAATALGGVALAVL